MGVTLTTASGDVFRALILVRQNKDGKHPRQTDRHEGHDSHQVPERVHAHEKIRARTVTVIVVVSVKRRHDCAVVCALPCIDGTGASFVRRQRRRIRRRRRRSDIRLRRNHRCFCLSTRAQHECRCERDQEPNHDSLADETGHECPSLWSSESVLNRQMWTSRERLVIPNLSTTYTFWIYVVDYSISVIKCQRTVDVSPWTSSSILTLICCICSGE